ncbi:MAG: phosphoribosylglycinamide formyltransferase [Phycisphaerae bacterium]|jgi:phosphoribosylglycinamide formyltransferase 1|nr:phosphoribosylglycinamide formyltransferase [Phycisphaerae bacterium]
MTTNIAVLCSGGGRTILNLLDRIEDGLLDANIILAIASNHDIPAVERLASRGIEVAIAQQENDTASMGDMNIQAWLNEIKPDLICLCGYFRLLPIEPWMEGRVLNIHPALLPRHGGKGMFGMRVHDAVIQTGDVETGCTVHFVDEVYDHGPQILQKTCEVLPNDTSQMIADKVFLLECEAYPEAIRRVSEQLKV